MSPTMTDPSCQAQRLVTLALVAGKEKFANELLDVRPPGSTHLAAPTASLTAPASAATASPSKTSVFEACYALEDLAAAAMAEAAAPSLRPEAISSASLGQAEQDNTFVQRACQGKRACANRLQPSGVFAVCSRVKLCDDLA